MKHINNFHQFRINENILVKDNKIKTYEKLLINSVISFMKIKLNFDAKIIVKKKQSTNLLGDIQINDNSVNNNKFTLFFNSNQSYIQIIKSLIHELTHIKQVSKGELKPSGDYKFIIWKDNFTMNVKEYYKLGKDIEKYKNLPWESEAYSNMNIFYDEYINSNLWKELKGIDNNLDFIIDNI
jgi:hypothetical protein